jgi:hypothetical protein
MCIMLPIEPELTNALGTNFKYFTLTSVVHLLQNIIQYMHTSKLEKSC